MFHRLWGYIKQLFRSTAERAMDPEIEIEQAITEARKQDQTLRNQAARIIAHRTQLESKIESAADMVGESREIAKKALLRAEEARLAGQEDQVAKWTQAAQSQALKLQAAESNLDGLKQQYETAVVQSSDAKRSVQQNAMRLQELAAKRMELVGKLQQAKMQEAVNSAVESISASMEMDAPSLERVEEKIEGRLANAKARTELREVTPEGAEAELREAISIAGADAKLDELRAELGLTE
ncbi:MAG: PspA/IM30 family protein [Acidimicrobiia bacterium]|nr:PspA/IM30 family protein [Acidimicrobiia bacterium]